MKKFKARIILDVNNDGTKMTVEKTQKMTIKDALTNFDNGYLFNTIPLIEESKEFVNDPELDYDLYNVTIKSGEEIKSELEEIISEGLYEFIQGPYLYENFDVHGSARVNKIEITDISLDELREEAVKVSQEYHDEMDAEEKVIYKVK